MDVNERIFVSRYCGLSHLRGDTLSAATTTRNRAIPRRFISFPGWSNDLPVVSTAAARFNVPFNCIVASFDHASNTGIGKGTIVNPLFLKGGSLHGLTGHGTQSVPIPRVCETII